MQPQPTQTTLPAETPDLASLLQALTHTHRSLQQQAARSVDVALVVRNWLFGWYIVKFEQGNAEHAVLYGKKLMQRLAEGLSSKGISGTSPTSLRQCRSFFLAYEKIQQTVSVESLPEVLKHHLTLGWSHYVQLLTLENETERSFYEIEAKANSWGVRELKRQIESSLYQRLALSRDKDQIHALGQQGQVISRAEDVLKNPYVLEFLDLPQHPAYSEHDLESAYSGLS